MPVPAPSQSTPENQRFAEDAEDTGATSSLIFDQENPIFGFYYTHACSATNAVRFTILASPIAPVVNQ